MAGVYVEKFQLYVPSVEAAKDVFGGSLGLRVIKEMESCVWFRMNEYTTLMCWVRAVSKKEVKAYSYAIDLVADTKLIEASHRMLKRKGYQVKLNRLKLDAGGECLQLYVTMKDPTVSVTVSDYLMVKET